MMRRLLSLAMMLCLVATASMAQVTTSAIRGKVQSATGEEIIGATIQAVHTSTGTKYGAVTNVTGNFTLTGLRAGGPYTVKVSYVGFRTKVFEGLALQLGQTFELDVEVAEDSQQLGEVVVTADKSSVFNLNRMGAAENFNSSAIQQTASVNRSVFDVAKMNPLAVQTSGGLSIAGANNRYNSFQIDGTVSNDVFGLAGTGTNGGQAGTNPISIEAIDEIQVVVAPFDVRQSGFTGGGVNAVTKSGTNEFHGSVYGLFRNESFYGKTEKYDEDVDDQEYKTYGFTVGGPIIKNKLFFFANYEKVDNSSPATNLIGKDSGVTTAEADQIINHLKTIAPNYETGGYGVLDRKTESNKFLTRLDWNINDQHKLTFRYSLVDAERDNFSNSYSNPKFNNNAQTFSSKTNNFVAELQSQFGNGLSNEFRVGYTMVRDERSPFGDPFPYIQVGGLGSNGRNKLDIGTERYSMANALDQDVFTIEDNVTYQTGDHTLTFGTRNEFFNLKNTFIAWNYGVYYYYSLDDFLAVGTPAEAAPGRYQYQYVNPEVGDPRWASEFGAAQLGFYAQDEWRVNDNLRLTYGLRVDIPMFFDEPTSNEDFNNSALAKKHGVSTDQMPKTAPLFSPRVGFRWYANDDHTTLLRGGSGLFTGRVPFVWISNAFSKTGNEIMTTYSKPNKFVADPHGQPVPTSNATYEVDVVADDFKFPQVFRTNLAVEQQLPFGVKGTLEAMYSKTLNNILYKNLNYEQDGTVGIAAVGADRPKYSKVDDRFTEVILLDNTNKGYTANLTAKLEKSFDFGLNAMAAYTWGKSTSINDGTSSQAYSSWKYNPTYYGDSKLDETYSKFDVRNRVIASVSYRKEYLGCFATEASLFYQGFNGGRYSLVGYYKDDLNKDGRAGNEVLYIPTDAEIAGMTFKKPENKQVFTDWVHNTDGVKNRQGTYMPRYSMRMPFEHHFDFHFAQEFFFDVKGKRNTLQFTFDVMNVGNLINDSWGTSYQTMSGYDQTPLRYNESADQFEWKGGSFYKEADASSRWYGQIGLKYIF